MAPIRRSATVAPPSPPPGLAFGSLDFYSGGYLLPEGDYAMEHNVVLHAFTKQDGTSVGEPKLGVMLTAHLLNGGGAVEQFLSMGSKAHLSFGPREDGKGLQAIPGGPAVTAARSTNWQLYLKSLYDTGLGEGVFMDDIGVLDGIWVHTQNVPEPEERKGFGGAKTGEVEQERKGSGLIPVVTAILDGGKPWEGGGGFPDANAPAPKAVARPAPRAVARPVAVPAQAAAAVDADDVMTAAINAVTDVITKSPTPAITKLALRTGVFKLVQASQGGEMGNAVLNTFFGSDEALNQVLQPLGYVAAAGQVKPT